MMFQKTFGHRAVVALLGLTLAGTAVAQEAPGA